MKTLKNYIILAAFFGICAPSFAQSADIKPLLDQYYALKDALVKSDAVLASGEAKKMLTVAKGIDSEKEDTKKLLLSIRQNLEHLAGKKDLSNQRNHFKELSGNMQDLISKSGIVGQTVYVQYCPMAFKDTGGKWLSAEKEIKNPYYGDKMLKCGRVQEIIK
jgi:membrane fusion protein, copper/silver efflux system